jgi:hypothetical protein
MDQEHSFLLWDYYQRVDKLNTVGSGRDTGVVLNNSGYCLVKSVAFPNNTDKWPTKLIVY